MADAQKTDAVSADKLAELDEGGLLEQMVESFKPRDDAAKERATDLIKNFVAQLLDPKLVVQRNLIDTINARIAAIDELISRQVDEVLHHPEFQQLEGTWRGIHKLVSSSETGDSMKIRVLNAKKEELHRDFASAVEFTESSVWKMVYDQEFGTYGGDPYAALIGDYEFDKSPQDVELLSEISRVAAAAHAPFVSSAAPAMFNMERFSQMPDPRDLEKIFDKNNPENTKWLSFRDSPDSRFVALVLPHVLRRQPYGSKSDRCDAFDYEENVGDDDRAYLWGNAAYEYAERLTAAFSKYAWCVAIRGPEGGGLVENLPIHTFQSREGDVGAKCPTEVAIPETRENELSNLGFIALVNCKNSDYAAFFGGNAVHRPKKYQDAAANASEDLSRRIPYLMCTSRIAHYLKAMCRDKIGSFMSRDECEQFLRRWIMQYTLASDTADAEMKAERPLREASVEVVENKARPGSYQAVAMLRPHFQLEELGVSLRLVAELPQSAA